MSDRGDIQEWRDVLAFWFPEGRALEVDADRHDEQWFWRMRGGADEEIIARFSDLTTRAATGELDHWASEPEGRLALIILLDQFPRSLWRCTPRAFSHDPAALSLTREGLLHGPYAPHATTLLTVYFVHPLYTSLRT